MPRACTACAREKGELLDINRALTQTDESFRSVGSRFNLSAQSVKRHAHAHLGLRRSEEQATKSKSAPTKRSSSVAPSRNDSTSDSRCDKCGIDVSASTNPENIILRADRIAALIERVALRASGAEQERLLLISADRLTKALEVLLRARSVGGFSAASSSLSVNVGINGGGAQQLAAVSDAELRLMISKLRQEIGTSEQVALPSGNGVVEEAEE